MGERVGGGVEGVGVGVGVGKWVSGWVGMGGDGGGECGAGGKEQNRGQGTVARWLDHPRDGWVAGMGRRKGLAAARRGSMGQSRELARSQRQQEVAKKHGMRAGCKGKRWHEQGDACWARSRPASSCLRCSHARACPSTGRISRMPDVYVSFL